MSTPLHIDKLQAWFLALAQQAALIELVVLAVCMGLAWFLTSLLRRAVGTKEDQPFLFGWKILDSVMFPVLLLCLGYAARAMLAASLPITVFTVAMPVLVALVAIRLGVKVLQVAFKDAPLVRALERTISWLVWLGLVLWISGLLPLILAELDTIHWRVGASSMSVRTLIEGTLTAGVVLIVALWISSAIETRLLRSAVGNDLSLRKAVSNATRALLVFVGLLVALSAVGIDLTALSVLGGAIGVGIGFGLQKLAASYVSGFVILAEHSVRIGDMVRVDGFEGRITNINARYTVVRALTGRESIVPNEIFISSRIENLSLADSRVMLSTVVSVGYDSDVDLVLRLLSNAASSQTRVLKDPDPVPSVNLTNLGVDGLEFTVNFWVLDPENGQQNIRSLVNVAILKSLKEHGIQIPYPQRVVHLASAVVPVSLGGIE
ncbi:MAG: small-conductance mechanosensitive channel [Litorivivens sp.]